MKLARHLASPRIPLPWLVAVYRVGSTLCTHLESTVVPGHLWMGERTPAPPQYHDRINLAGTSQPVPRTSHELASPSTHSESYGVACHSVLLRGHSPSTQSETYGVACHSVLQRGYSHSTQSESYGVACHSVLLRARLSQYTE